MSERQPSGNAWGWILPTVLVGLVAGLLYLFSSDEEPLVGEVSSGPARLPATDAPGDPLPSEPVQHESAPPAVAPAPVAAPVPAPSHPVARLVGDGGPPGASGQSASAELPPQDPERIPTIHFDPPDTETMLRRARYLREVIEERIVQLQDQEEEARQAGDERRARVLAHMIERLQADRPHADQNVRDLEQKVAQESSR